MNTQYERNSVYIASANYRIRRRERKLRSALLVFFFAFSVICAGVYVIISSMPY